MNKTYEAPVAEVFEMQMPTVLMVSQADLGLDDPLGPSGL